MIYLTAQAYPPRSGGIENLMGAFASYCGQSGQTVQVLADGKKNNLTERADKTSVYIHRFSGLKPLRRRKKAKYLAACLAQNPGPVFADSWKSIEYLPKDLDHRIVVFAHGNEYPRADQNGVFPKKARIRKALSKATHMIAVSQDTKARSAPFRPKDMPVDIIHPPVEPIANITDVDKAFAKAVWPHESAVKCLALCRLIDWKGVDMAIRAVANRKDCQLVVAGTGDDRSRLERLVDYHHARDRIVFAGRVEGGRKAALFQSADIFLQPGRKVGDQCEGFGITYVEAALHGLPSISGDQGGAPEAVIDGETALVVDATQLENVTEALEKLVTNTDMRSHMSLNAKAHAQRLLWPRQIDRILAIAGL